MDNYKVCFIIALKYIRGYVSFIDYYVDNIKLFYPNSLIVIVDNNSKYIEDVYEKLQKYKDDDNLHIMINNTNCKFELGAYKVGINYILSNNLINNYDYYIFTQDTFVIKNKYDFNNLLINNITATPIKSHINDNYNRHYASYLRPLVQSVLIKLNLNNSINDLRICWANSFILHNSKIEDFLCITNDIIIINKDGACDCERFLAGILYKLNNNKNYTIDDIYKEHEIHPHLWNIDILTNITHYYFTKKITNKNENTTD